MSIHFEVIKTKNGHTRSFPCRTSRAVTNLVHDMLNADCEITIRPFVSKLPAVLTTEESYKRVA